MKKFRKRFGEIIEAENLLKKDLIIAIANKIGVSKSVEVPVYLKMGFMVYGEPGLTILVEQMAGQHFKCMVMNKNNDYINLLLADLGYLVALEEHLDIFHKQEVK